MSKFINADGNWFFVRSWGRENKPILLMLHGFPEYSGAWEEMSEFLSDKFYCLAPDQRGYGQSYAPERIADYKMELLIQDLKGIIEHFGGPALVLGHDWGAAAAYGLAIAYPELVSRLIIMNGVHPIPFQRALCEDKAQNAASQYISWLRRKGSETVLAKNDFERLQTMFGQSMDMTWLSGVRLGRYKLAWKDADGVGAMLNWYRATGLRVPKPEDVPQQMPEVHSDAMRISMPHLVLWGKNDTALLPQSYTGLTELCDEVTIIEFTNADHWLHHQVPDELSKAILTWLDQ